MARRIAASHEKEQRYKDKVSHTHNINSQPLNSNLTRIVIENN
jgi:hypothetical protein